MISLGPMVHGVQKRSKAPKGFTLIEMMAVLVLFGLLTAVVLPNFERWFSNTERRVSASELAVRLQKLYARAALLGQNVELNAATASEKLADGQPALDLPAGWSFAEGQSLSIRASGLCQAASIQFASAVQTLVLDVKTDNCEIAIRSNTASSQ
ncbi:pilus assembly FimT family protein [Acidovorax carolinensis]|nr:type II secretion system protein [Acidovorax carolinensis]